MIGSPCLVLTELTSQSVCGPADPAPPSVQNMGVNHRRANVLVTQEFLDRANVIAIGQQVRGERMPKRVARDSLGQPSLSHGVLMAFCTSDS